MRSDIFATVVLLLGPGCMGRHHTDPFQRSDDPRALITAQVDGRSIRPDLVYHFDDLVGEVSEWIDTSMAYTGHASLVMHRGTEYSPSIKRAVKDVADGLTAIDIGFWYRSDDRDPRIGPVATIERANGQRIAWFGKEVQASEHAPGAWLRFNARFLIRDVPVAATDTVVIYLWDHGRARVHIDDLEIYFHSDRTIGSAAAGPFGVRQPRVMTLDPRPIPLDSVPFLAESGDLPHPLPHALASMSTDTALHRVPLDKGELRWRSGDALMIWATTLDTVLIRPFCHAAHLDMLTYEHVLGARAGNGVLLIGYDTGAGGEAAGPVPLAAIMDLRPLP